MSTGLNDRLHRLADQPAPPQRLDITQVLRGGRRVRRRRRVGVVGGCVPAAGAIAAATVLPSWTPAKPSRLAPPLQQTRSRTVLTPDASFGWLPPGHDLGTVIIDDQHDVQSFMRQLGSQPPPNTTVNGALAWDSRLGPAGKKSASHGEQIVVYGIRGLVDRTTLLPEADWTRTPFN